MKIELTQDYIRTRSIVEDECWIWSNFKNKQGYGEVRRNKKRILAHRLSFFLWNSYWPEVCRHVCDNPSCVNPDHLLDGTHADNVRDRDERNRGRWATNESHGRAKFSDETIKKVREMRECGMAQAAIGERLGMSQTHVSRICLNRNRIIR